MGQTGSPLKIGVASRPIPTETVNGDDVSLTRRDDGSVRVSVVDALGHGPEAHQVALTALAALDARPGLTATDSLRACHEALRGSRGAAISVGLFSPSTAGPDRLSFGGIGNVEAMLVANGVTERPICYRGIVGFSPRLPRAFEFELQPGWIVVIFTDGIRARFTPTDLEGALADPQLVADRLLAEFARPSDDATVVVIVDDVSSVA